MNRNQIKVSVIIPVYNVARYVAKCAESLFSQSLEEMEYIFIDDCSSDGSMAVVKEVLAGYPARESEVQLLRHEVNEGVIRTRQEGLDKARGEYVIFCDSDDWVEPEMYEEMYEAAKETDADIVISAMMVEMEGKSRVRGSGGIGNREDYVKKMLTGEIHCGSCNKLVRRRLYNAGGVRFPEGIDLWEDTCVSIPLALVADRIVAMDKPFYHYRQINPQAYTRHITAQRAEDVIRAIDFIEGVLKGTKDVYQEELTHRKLTAKYFLLDSTKGEVRKRVSRLFPEIKSLAGACGLPGHIRLGLMLNDIFGATGFRIYSRLKRLVRKMSKRE